MSTSKKQVSVLTKVLIIVVIAAAVIAITLFRFLGNCEALGNSIGTAVAKAVGSLDGYSHGTKDGKDDAINNPDTKVDIENAVKNIGKLEVLKGDSYCVDYHEDGKDTDYSAVYMIPAEFVFTVDLTQATVSVSEDGSVVYIFLPTPEVTFNIDEENIEKALEIKNKSIKYGESDGVRIFLSSLKDTQEKAEEKLANYDSLYNLAESNALRDVESFANSVSVNGNSFQVHFNEVKGGN